MSRAAVRDAILADARLIALGFDSDSVVPNYDGDQRPNDKLFMILHYEAPEWDVNVRREMQNLTIWVHCYKEFSTDFAWVDTVLMILDDILNNMVHVPGNDGITLTLAESGAKSRDLRDDVYQTICRSGSYRILSRQTVSV